MKDLPKNLAPYKRTPTFVAESIPKGLLKAHQTKAGTWGKIVILEGQLLYRILQPTVSEVVLSPDTYGVVEPTILHEIAPIGEVSFYVEFYKGDDLTAA